jgi:hypothetical protein
MSNNTTHTEDAIISPLFAMLRAKQELGPRITLGKVVYLDHQMDSRRPIAPHLIFANELFAAYPGMISETGFDFRMHLGYLTQFSVSQAELTQALRTGLLTILSDQNEEIHFPLEEADITQLVADCITIRELASSILPSEQVAIRLRRNGTTIRETRQILEQAELCRDMLKQTVVSIIEAMQKSGQDLLSPIEVEALMPLNERIQLSHQARERLSN